MVCASKPIETALLPRLAQSLRNMPPPFATPGRLRILARMNIRNFARLSARIYFVRTLKLFKITSPNFTATSQN